MEIVIPKIKGIPYDPNKVVRILNTQQTAAYLKHGAELLDVYQSVDTKTGTPLLVYIFDRSKTKELYDLWCKHELK
jgi:hypothetical protein